MTSSLIIVNNFSVRAINILQSLIQQRFKCGGITPKVQKKFQKLLQLRKDKNHSINKMNNENKNESYIDRLFNHICDNWTTEIDISMIQLHSKEYYSYISYFFYIDNDNNKEFDFGLLLNLFNAMIAFTTVIEYVLKYDNIIIIL